MPPRDMHRVSGYPVTDVDFDDCEAAYSAYLAAGVRHGYDSSEAIAAFEDALSEFGYKVDETGNLHWRIIATPT